MKKTRLAILTVLVLVFAMAFPLVASAATAADIKAALSETVTTAYGQTVSIGSGAINAAEIYLQNNDVPAANLDQVLDAINAAKASVRAYNAQLDAASLRDLVLPNLQAAVNAVNFQGNDFPITLDQVLVYGGSIDNVYYGGSNPLAQTGADYSALAIFGGIAALVIAAGVAITRRHRLLAAE